MSIFHSQFTLSIQLPHRCHWLQNCALRMNFSRAGVNKHPSSMRSCLLFIKYLCSVLLEFLNVCFLDFANGKTLEKGKE